MDTKLYGQSFTCCAWRMKTAELRYLKSSLLRSFLIVNSLCYASAGQWTPEQNHEWKPALYTIWPDPVNTHISLTTSTCAVFRRTSSTQWEKFFMARQSWKQVRFSTRMICLDRIKIEERWKDKCEPIQSIAYCTLHSFQINCTFKVFLSVTLLVIFHNCSKPIHSLTINSSSDAHTSGLYSIQVLCSSLLRRRRRLIIMIWNLRKRSNSVKSSALSVHRRRVSRAIHRATSHIHSKSVERREAWETNFILRYQS